MAAIAISAPDALARGSVSMVAANTDARSVVVQTSASMALICRLHQKPAKHYKSSIGLSVEPQPDAWNESLAHHAFILLVR